jgi:hypothetical protein
MRWVVMAVLWVSCVAELLPQARPDPDQPGGHRRGDQPWRTELPRQEWRDILDGMTAEYLAAFMALPAAMRARESRRLVAERREREEQAFVDGLAAETRDTLLSLPEDERRLFILKLRVKEKLDRVVADARALGVLDEAGAESALALGDPAAQASRILDLQKASFLTLHEDVISGLPPHVRRELARLSPGDFFRHPAVEEVRYVGAFFRRGLLRLRRGGEGVIRPFLEALAENRLDTFQESCLRPHFRDMLRPATDEERRRTAERLGSVVFFRELGRPDRRPQRDGFHLPPELFERLSPEEQEVFLRLPEGARRRLVERRFPELREGPGGPQTQEPRMHDLLARWSALSQEEKRRLREAKVSEVIARLFDDRQGGEGPLRPALQELLDRLAAPERAELEALPMPERLRRLRDRFPEAFRPR